MWKEALKDYNEVIPLCNCMGRKSMRRSPYSSSLISKAGYQVLTLLIVYQYFKRFCVAGSVSELRARVQHPIHTQQQGQLPLVSGGPGALHS